MSDFDSNPFADPNATNPFTDHSVTQASRGGQKVEGLEEFNPFANDQFNPQAGAARTQPPAPQPAVLQTYDAPPPAYSPQPTQAASDYLQSRQEELERKAAELDRREQAMQSNILHAARINNFPPLPSKFPIRPCFYQDISIDIPAQFQALVKMNFYLWIAYVCLLFLNIWVSVAYFGISVTISKENKSGTTLGLSILYFILWTPASFVCWFRPVYNAFRSDSSFFFFVYFFIFFFQFCANVIQCLGIDGSGTVGFLTGFMMSSTANASGIAIGITMIIVGVLFAIMAAICMILLFRVHRLYRSTGASFSKAQAEFAQGIVTNRTVQQTAGSVAASAARGAAEQSLYGGESRY